MNLNNDTLFTLNIFHKNRGGVMRTIRGSLSGSNGENFSHSKRFNNIVYVNILWKLDQCHSHFIGYECYGKKFQQTHTRARLLTHAHGARLYVCIWNCVPMLFQEKDGLNCAHHTDRMLTVSCTMCCAYCGNWQPILQQTREFPEYVSIKWMWNTVGISRRAWNSHTHTHIYLILKVSLS